MALNPVEVVSYVKSTMPGFREFMTVDELNESSMRLAREHGDLVEAFEAGGSRSGEPVYALRIGDGDRCVLAFAFPHPNEPVGGLTLEYLSWRLVLDRELLRSLNSTWVIVKVADVFGARLNEGWFKGAFHPRKYALNYYRPPGYKQVEWSFPISYKSLKWDRPTPETRALMKLIDEYRPDLIFSLHNAGFCGTYYYLSKPMPALHKALKQVPRLLDVPVHLGEPEVPYAKLLDEAVFLMLSVKDTYDFIEENTGRDPAEVIRHGGCSLDYALERSPNVVELVCEVPYIYDDRVGDTRPLGVPRRDMILLSVQLSVERLRWAEELLESLDPYLDKESPFYESLSEFVRYGKEHLEATKAWALRTPSLLRSCTVAEAFDAVTARVYWADMLRKGLAYRLIEDSLRRADASAARRLEEARAEVLRGLDGLVRLFETLSGYKVIEPWRLAAIQASSMILTVKAYE